MQILFQSRTTLYSVPGGDTIQILKTAEALRPMGYDIDISTDLEPDVRSYEIVHIFNLTRPQEVYLQTLNAKRQGKKVVLSTIYVDFSEYDRKGRSSLIWKLITKALNPERVEYLKILARTLKNFETNKGTWLILKHGYRDLQSNILDMTDVLLPNSESERKRIIKDFPEFSGKKYTIVPNAVDTRLFDSYSGNTSNETEKFKGCILCVARIEARKNQLNLVRAVNDLPLSLVLIGKPAPNHLSYYEQIKKEAGSNIHMIGEIEHSLLPKFYKVAKVHALVSWMETTGLSSLEAGIMGCNLVITDKGDTRDYFKDFAFYCEPDSVESIRKAVIKAYESSVNIKLQQHILQNFTWEKAAEATLKGYEMALSC